MSDFKSLSELWRYGQAAHYLDVSIVSLRRMVAQRRVPFMKPLGPRGRVYFDPEDLRALIERSRIQAAPAARAAS